MPKFRSRSRRRRGGSSSRSKRLARKIVRALRIGFRI